MFMCAFFKKNKRGDSPLSPEQLPGVKKIHFYYRIMVERYGLSIWTGCISIQSWFGKS